MSKKVTKKAVKKVTKKKSTKRTAKKKTSALKTLRRRQRRKSTLTKAELKHFRELLIEKLKEITGDVNHIESEALKTSRLDASGDLSSMPIHMADIGSDNYEQEFSLGLMDSERKIVHEIIAALKRIEEGTYGICEGTGQPIPKVRLEGIPWTSYCVQYAEMIEKGLASEDDHWYDYESDEEDSDDEMKDDEDEDYIDDDEEEKNALFYGIDDDGEELI